MDSKILSLFKENRSQELKECLRNCDKTQVKSLLECRIAKGKGDISVFLRAIFAGSDTDSDDGQEMRMEVFKQCITLLQNCELSTKVATQIVSVLMLETESLRPSYLAELAEIYTDSLKSGRSQNIKCLELLPRVLAALKASEEVKYKDSSMTGTAYKSHVLNTLCSARWSSGNALQMASMFRDVTMTSSELLFALQKLLRMLADLEAQEVPPLVYQLLLLTTRGHKRVVLEGVCQFFISQDVKYKQQVNSSSDVDICESSAWMEHLREVEGTSLLHVNFAMKQDQELAREFLKYLKSGLPSEVLQPFNIALLMCLSKLQRFQEQVFDYVKSSVLQCYKDRARQQRSHWVRENESRVPDIAVAILDTVKNSSCGWDSVIQGLVQLGFTLMDAFAPRAAFGKPVDSKPTCEQTPAQQACSLGAKLLQETFKTHKMVRSEIIEQILNRVVTSSNATVTHYLDLLGEIIVAYPQLLLDQSARLRESFDYLCYLSVTTAEALIRALSPLLRLSATLRDALVLVLRKAVFSKQVDSRVVAVKGFAIFLKQFRLQGSITCSQASQSLPSLSASQVQVDVHTGHTALSTEAFCWELLGNLRRAFTQQAEVRTALYESLFEVLCRNTRLAPHILQLLHTQWQKYYVREEGVQPPVKLQACITTQGDKVCVAEPLAHLLSAIVHCVLVALKFDLDENEAGTSADGHVTEDLEDMLESLKERMIQSDLEEFELDKAADFSTGSSVGVKNTIFALLVSDMCVVLMEYAFSTGNYEVSVSNEVLSLFDKYCKVQSFLKDNPSSASSKKARAHTAKSRLSFKVLSNLLQAFISDTSPAHQAGLNVLRGRDDLFKYLLSAALDKLIQVRDKGRCEGPEGHLHEKLFKYTSTLAKDLACYYSDVVTGRANASTDKRACLASLALEAFSECINIVCLRYKGQVDQFLAVMDPETDSGTDHNEEEAIYNSVKKLQRLVMRALSDTSEEECGNVKDAELLIHVIGRLVTCLPTGSNQYALVYNWLRELCTQKNIGGTSNHSLTNQLLSLLIEMTSQQKSVASLLIEMARDIHCEMGDIDQEVEIEEETVLGVLATAPSSQHAIPVLLGAIERELDDADWMISHLRANITMTSQSTAIENDHLTQRESQEKSVCSKLGHFINVFHELVQSAIASGTNTELLLKQLTKLYTTMSNLVKLYVSMYQNKQGHMSTRFEKLVHHSGKNLTPFVYTMITYIQAIQNEGVQQASGKRRHGKKVTAADVLGKSRILRESRSIPALIYSIEQYERYLIQLSKRTKVNLMEHFKMSTSRDFRIQAEVLKEVLEAQNSPSEDDEEEEDGDKSSNVNETRTNSDRESGNEENETPDRKKRKTQVSQAKKTTQNKDAKLSKAKKRSSVY